jgi:flagellar basal body rod protein FlgB
MTTPLHSSATGSLGALHAAFRFSAQRHEVLADSVANVASFEESLSQAIDAKRDVDAARLDPNLLPAASPASVAIGGELLSHDGSDRSHEVLAQRMTSNLLRFRALAGMIRGRWDMLGTVTRGRL